MDGDVFGSCLTLIFGLEYFQVFSFVVEFVYTYLIILVLRYVHYRMYYYLFFINALCR